MMEDSHRSVSGCKPDSLLPQLDTRGTAAVAIEAFGADV